MCEQQGNIKHLDETVKALSANLRLFNPEEQNYILMSLRDAIYVNRLHELEQLEVDVANASHKLNQLKKCNGEIGYSKL